jgi:hypothetical protein
MEPPQAFDASDTGGQQPQVEPQDWQPAEVAHQQDWQPMPGQEGQFQPSMMDGSFDGGWGMPGGGMMGHGPLGGMADPDALHDEYSEGSMPQSMPEGPCVALPALSLRQPFASLALYGVKELEARNRPALKQLSGPLAIHVSHREEPFGSPLLSTAVAILRRRYPDDTISQLFALPQTHAQGHGCIVGLVDVEATWPADLFNEIEQSQLTEQAVFPVSGRPSYSASPSSQRLRPIPFACWLSESGSRAPGAGWWHVHHAAAQPTLAKVSRSHERLQ